MAALLRDVRLLDRYPCQVETKGGSVNFAPKKIIILSNKAPEDWYGKNKCAWKHESKELN